MTHRTQPASIALSLGLVAALLALCLRLMAPAGWMPVASGHGVMFTLCSGSGTATVGFGKDGKPVTPDNGGAHGNPCAFGGIATPPLPALPPAVALQIFAIFIAMGLAATERPRLAIANWLRPPLRGPPLRV